MKSKFLRLLIVVALLLAACSSASTPEAAVPSQQPVTQPTGQPVEPTTAPVQEAPASLPDTDVVARVNDVPISRTLYETQVTNMQVAMRESGADEAMLAQAPEFVLQALIETELVLQDAERQGIVVTVAELEAKKQLFYEGSDGKDGLNAYLTDSDLTEEQLWAELRIQLIFGKVIDKVTNGSQDPALFDEYLQQLVAKANIEKFN